MGPEGTAAVSIGDSGTGKSHLLIALGTEAMAGYRVKTPWRPSLPTSSSRPPTR